MNKKFVFHFILSLVCILFILFTYEFEKGRKFGLEPGCDFSQRLSSIKSKNEVYKLGFRIGYSDDTMSQSRKDCAADKYLFRDKNGLTSIGCKPKDDICEKEWMEEQYKNGNIRRKSSN